MRPTTSFLRVAVVLIGLAPCAVMAGPRDALPHEGATFPQEAPATLPFIQLKLNSEQPAPCDAAHEGAIALHGGGAICVCSTGGTVGGPLNWHEVVSGQYCWPSRKP